MRGIFRRRQRWHYCEKQRLEQRVSAQREQTKAARCLFRHNSEGRICRGQCKSGERNVFLSALPASEAGCARISARTNEIANSADRIGRHANRLPRMQVSLLVGCFSVFLMPGKWPHVIALPIRRAFISEIFRWHHFQLR